MGDMLVFVKYKNQFYNNIIILPLSQYKKQYEEGKNVARIQCQSSFSYIARS